MWPHTKPNEDFDRVPKNDTVNMRTARGRGGDPPRDPLGGRGGRHLSCLGGAQLQTQNTKEINTKPSMTIQTVVDDISKSLKFDTFA